MLDDSRLEQSSVVANNAMNRERGLDGVNSYARELGFHPLETLAPGKAWLDLCCGSGRALIEASRHDRHDRRDTRGAYILVGVDLVHGLHYVGDKLGLLARAASWLAPGGLLIGHLDLANVKTPMPFRPHRFGLEYDARRRLVKCRGPRRFDFPYEYVGADADAGPNYTGQPAVDSYYRAQSTS